MFSLKLTEEQFARLEEWKKKFKPSGTAIGGNYTYMITPTGVGVIVKVKHYKGFCH